ncbi:MAG: hypothetical protein BJ554DRAFT_8339 [Olpidium bornovanus]|uniref:Uncharacterized protein n=1 Tax=Olpidium bornovanus TaxID=278681 RepID=A0A8H7ZV37_9FUNG|nr:MAG: hypothetical protein BJ554DRAFT_8339 [Olpidium bornovanus]
MQSAVLSRGPGEGGRAGGERKARTGERGGGAWGSASAREKKKKKKKGKKERGKNQPTTPAAQQPTALLLPVFPASASGEKPKPSQVLANSMTPEQKAFTSQYMRAFREHGVKPDETPKSDGGHH